MRIFIKRYGYELSNTTMHKYMNKELNLCAVIMHSKPGYKTDKKNKIFDNLLNQNFTVDCKNKFRSVSGDTLSATSSHKRQSVW